MTGILRPIAGSVASWTTMGFTATDFNNLANGSFVLANTAIDNTSNPDLLTNIRGKMTVGGTTTTATYLLFWLLQLSDTGVYGDGTPSGTVLPGSGYLVGSMTTRSGITNGNVLSWSLGPLVLPRTSFKWGISQSLGAALNASAAFVGEYETTNYNTNG